VAPGSRYVPKSSSDNGLNGKFGQINLRLGESVDLMFTFRNSLTNVLIDLRSFYFTFFDVDQGPSNHETICMDDDQYHSVQVVRRVCVCFFSFLFSPFRIYVYSSLY
jgi:hypothetical protein